MKVAAIQHDVVWEDPAANFAHLDGMLARAAHAGARLVVLTEMFSTGFSMRTERVAEPVDGPSTQFLVDQARKRSMWVCGSLPEQSAGDERPANTFVLVEPDGSVHRYRKIHPFTHGGEAAKYVAGDRHVVVEVEGVRCALFICYDLRFADEFWELAPSTDCYLVPANWPEVRRDHWRTLLRARAIENQAYVVGVNRVGRVGRLVYVGDSVVIGPSGETVAEADAGGLEAVVVGEVDPAVVARTRTELPFLPDRHSRR